MIKKLKSPNHNILLQIGRRSQHANSKELFRPSPPLVFKTIGFFSSIKPSTDFYSLSKTLVFKIIAFREGIGHLIHKMAAGTVICSNFFQFSSSLSSKTSGLISSITASKGRLEFVEVLLVKNFHVFFVSLQSCKAEQASILTVLTSPGFHITSIR